MANVKITNNRYTVDTLYQWDKNQVLQIYGLSLASIPSIHFTNDDLGRAIVRQATMDGAGVITVDVPNSLLQKPYKIKAYVCVYQGETFESLYEIAIPVKARSKPSDYTLENDEEVYSFIELENKLDNALSNVTAQYNNTISNVNNTATNAINNMNSKSAETIETVNTTREEALTEIETATDEALEQIEGIVSTTDTTLENSKAGGLRVISVSGASVQNGTPTPDAPQSIENVGDCVEMMQGGWQVSNGTYFTDNARICTKNQVPCTSGDVIKIATEKTPVANGYQIVFYANGTYLTSSYGSGTSNEYSATVPSGATSFVVTLVFDENTTPSTVGKITLTINGKYVVQFVEQGKNFVSLNDVALASAGYVYNGTRLTNTLPIGTYTFSMKHNIPSATGWWVQLINSGTGYISRTISGDRNGTHTSATFVLTEPCDQIKMYVNGACTVTDIQIEQGEVATGFETYKETVATVLLNEPLCDTDVMSKTEIARKRVVLVYDGSDDENWQSSSSLTGRYLISTSGLIKPNSLGLCSQAKSTSETTVVNCYYITASSQIAINTEFLTLDEWKAHLQETPIEFVCELVTPTTETLDTDSQIALNSLETFDTVTYLEIDSRTAPTEIEVEYGTTKVGATALKSLNEANNSVKSLKVANNLSTNEEGFVLDARMGKYLADLLTGAIKINRDYSDYLDISAGATGTAIIEPTIDDGYTVIGFAGIVSDVEGVCVESFYIEDNTIVVTARNTTSDGKETMVTVDYILMKTDLLG